MQIHRYNCIYNYDTTQEVFEVEQVTNAFGHVDNRWLLVKWKGHENPEWERQHLLERDGCHEVIREFWAHSGLNPCEHFIQDAEDKHRCAVCCKVYKRAQDLKAHRTCTGHHKEKHTEVTKTVFQDVAGESRKSSNGCSNSWQRRNGETCQLINHDISNA